jgi:hypothetical protein
LGSTSGVTVRHTFITTAIERGQQSGVGLDQIRTFSRHSQPHHDADLSRDREQTYRILADVVADCLEKDGA